MNRGLLIALSITAALAAVVLFAGIYFWNTGASSPGAGVQPELTDAASPAEAFIPDQVDNGNDKGVDDSGEPGALSTVETRLAQAEQESGNLQKFFTDLQALCEGEGLDQEACAALLEEALADHPDREYARMLLDIMESFPEYQQSLGRTVLSTDLSPRERYRRLQEKREAAFGDQATRALYGQEAALAEYRFAYGELLEHEAPHLTPEQRRQRLEALREETFGPWYEQLSEAQGDHGAYRQELQLMLTGVEDQAERERIIRQLREQHFDEDTVERMEERDAQQQQQARQVEAFKEAEAALEAELAELRDTMPEDQWRERYQREMEQLRREHFSQ